MICAVNFLHIVYNNAVLYRAQVEHRHYRAAVLSEKLTEHCEASILSAPALSRAFGNDNWVIKHLGNALYFSKRHFRVLLHYVVDFLAAKINILLACAQPLQNVAGPAEYKCLSVRPASLIPGVNLALVVLVYGEPRLDRYLVVCENRVLVAQVRRRGAPLLSRESPARRRVAGLNLAGGVAVHSGVLSGSILYPSLKFEQLLEPLVRIKLFIKGILFRLISLIHRSFFCDRLREHGLIQNPVKLPVTGILVLFFSA